MDPGAYCRQVEAYLCRQNEGHLIRIVGPSFELVSAWSGAGVPLSVVRRAVDRACLRRRARGGRRRPLRIEYCEADVLDLFDDWKRAIGVGLGGPSSDADPRTGEESGGAAARRRASLAAHMERVVARLSACAVSEPGSLGGRAAEAAAEIENVRAGGVPRGKARQQLLDRLAELDAGLLAAAREAAGEPLLLRLREEAERELAPFRDRMERGAFRRAVAAGRDRLLIDHFRLPRLAYD